MATIPGFQTNQWVSGYDVPQGWSLNTPMVYRNGVRGQYYNPQAASQNAPQQALGTKANAGKAYNGIKPGGGQSTATSSPNPYPNPTGSTTGQTSLYSQYQFPQIPSFDLFGTSQPQSQYQSHSQTGNPIVPGYTDLWGRPINGRPAGTVPVMGDNGTWTGNWELAGSGGGSSANQRQPYAWTAAGRANAANNPSYGSGTGGTTGGTSTDIGGGITGGTINNSDIGYLSSLIGGSGQLPMGMAPDAQREVRQTAQDVARQEAETGTLDVNRRATYEQARLDLARQMAEAESSLGYGGLAARLYELMNQDASTREGYMYGLMGSVL